VSSIDQALHEFTNFMDGGPPPPWIVLPLFVLSQPLLALVHELGHAGAALALSSGRVAIAIGRYPPLVARDLGRMTIAFHPVAPILRNHAECTPPAPKSRTEDALVALAGPAASLVTCIVARSALVHVSPGLLHDALWMVTFLSLVATVGNLVPFTFTDSQGRRRRSDGATILAALR
jgi:hypothetical protein